MMGGEVKLVKSNLHRSKNPFMMGEEGGGGGAGGVNPNLPRSHFHILPLSTSSRLNDSQVKCCLYKGGVTLQIAP